MGNGVKQGGVLSPILFNLYIDRLLIRLQKSGVGCHMNNIYMGELSYADGRELGPQRSRVPVTYMEQTHQTNTQMILLFHVLVCMV